MHWLPIETAPPFVTRLTALVGQRSEDGMRWMMVEVWDTAWGREWLINSGVTHYCRFDRPPSPDEDDAVRDTIAMLS